MSRPAVSLGKVSFATFLTPWFKKSPVVELSKGTTWAADQTSSGPRGVQCPECLLTGPAPSLGCSPYPREALVEPQALVEQIHSEEGSVGLRTGLGTHSIEICCHKGTHSLHPCQELGQEGSTPSTSHHHSWVTEDKFSPRPQPHIAAYLTPIPKEGS